MERDRGLESGVGGTGVRDRGAGIRGQRRKGRRSDVECRMSEDGRFAEN
jgi:hypothetical protein